MPVLEELMQRYDQELQRYSNGAIYLDNPAIPMCDREKWIPEFRKIINVLDSLVIQIKDVGYEMSNNQILNGFKKGRDQA